jgi:beta-glucosidase
LGGEAGAEGVCDVLTGAQSPCGKLSETYPVSVTDVPSSAAFPSRGRTAEYREGLYVGYRYFETAGVPTAFDFGFGLSYTTFEYSALEASEAEVAFDLANTGERPGAEVCQVYVGRRSPSTVHRPAKTLAAFAKVGLAPGQRRRVRLALPAAAFEVWDAATGSWRIEAGDYEVCVGASVRDVRLAAPLSLAGTAERLEQAPGLERYGVADVRQVPDAVFAALLGRPVPEASWGDGPLTRDDPLLRLGAARSPLARLAGAVIRGLVRRAEKAEQADLNVYFWTSMPFRAIAKMTNGAFTMAMVDALLVLVGGRHLRGLGRLVKERRRARRADRRLRAELEGTAP